VCVCDGREASGERHALVQGILDESWRAVPWNDELHEGYELCWELLMNEVHHLHAVSIREWRAEHEERYNCGCEIFAGSRVEDLVEHVCDIL
jgi:hypothetical protein